MPDYIPDSKRYDGRMPYRKCGRWGLKLPEITLGCWHNFGGETPTNLQKNMIHSSFDSGITHFDLANNYGPPYGSAEINVGKILQDLPRDEILITSKAGYDMWPGPYGEWGSRKYILASLDQSLKRMGVEYFDLFYSHRFDPNTPLDETLAALDSAVRQGKALYTGISSYSSEQTQKSIEVSKNNGFSPLIIHQPNYSMLNRWVEDSLLDTCERNGLGVIAFCPLFQGLLTDKYLNGIPKGSRASIHKSPLRKNEVSEQNLKVIHELNDHARQRGQSLAQMALAWVLRDQRVTSALIGASTASQIVENVKAVQQIEFTVDELGKLNRILAKANLPNSLWANEG
ncbi:MAG TPA: L-glyceraldehyde 3-phosphate reductase [Opitutae bacterium]|nr:L-glyceraldehyde 3-phosphate reductase [Opitutae bacterium]HCY59024.1 L-glyceraldehyde 3-phosphate reductase [Opitutae bacterium]|tara:strand:+ start:121 stop:1149 length:1029 start_codon:yes stop_codon:yes gene_type:complete